MNKVKKENGRFYTLRILLVKSEKFQQWTAVGSWEGFASDHSHAMAGEVKITV